MGVLTMSRVSALVATAVVLSWAHGAMAAPTSAATLVNDGLSCACFEGSELYIDASKSLLDETCRCPFASKVRKDVASVVAAMATKSAQDRIKIALAVEKKFLPLSPEHERMLRYDQQRYRWFLENVRCTCEGCKATVYFSNCQLTCAPAIVYKRRARVFLALGFSVDQLIDFYLAEHNATHSHREQVDRQWLLPRRQKKRGWMVPAFLILGAIIVLGGFMRRLVRRSASAAAEPQEQPSPLATGQTPALSEADRLRILDELEEIQG